MQDQLSAFNKNPDIAKQWSNHQAYQFAFNELFMRRRNNKIIGNNQRALFLPLLNRLIKTLESNCSVLDVGGGNGDMVDLALYQLTNATIDINEPNPLMLKGYQNKLQQYDNLSCGAIFDKPIEYYFDQNLPQFQSDYYHQILAIHMIYHLSDFRLNDIQPQQDLINFIRFLFDKLRPNGSLFLVYTDQRQTFTGKAASDYYHQHSAVKSSHMAQVITARETLLTNKGISTYLPSNSQLKAHHLKSHVYTHSLEELAMIGLISEIGHINDEPFEFNKFEHVLAYLKSHSEQVGLSLCQDSDRTGMWQVNQPQIVIELTKT